MEIFISSSRGERGNYYQGRSVLLSPLSWAIAEIYLNIGTEKVSEYSIFHGRNDRESWNNATFIGECKNSTQTFNFVRQRRNIAELAVYFKMTADFKHKPTVNLLRHFSRQRPQQIESLYYDLAEILYFAYWAQTYAKLNLNFSNKVTAPNRLRSKLSHLLWISRT